MDILEAIYQRRAVRNYTDQTVSPENLGKLIDAAIQAPTGWDGQFWAFGVIQGKSRLQDYSDRAKAFFFETYSPGHDPHSERREMLRNPDYNLFYNAGTLVTIYSKPGGQFNSIDCCLAAENFMLAACSMGLGTCPIGFSQSWLDQTEIKEEMGVPSQYTAVLPMIIGYPAGTSERVPRLQPEIYCGS